ncbi:hypothetical protein [Methylobacterium sp. Gmos1]
MKRREPAPPADLPDDPVILAGMIERSLKVALRTIADLRAELAPPPRPAAAQQQLSLLEPRP